MGIADELVRKYDCGTIINYDERELSDVLLKYLKKYDENNEKKHFYVGNEFDIKTELEKTIQVIDNTIEKGEQKTKIKKLPYPVEKTD